MSKISLFIARLALIILETTFVKIAAQTATSAKTALVSVSSAMLVTVSMNMDIVLKFKKIAQLVNFLTTRKFVRIVGAPAWNALTVQDSVKGAQLVRGLDQLGTPVRIVLISTTLTLIISVKLVQLIAQNAKMAMELAHSVNLDTI